MASLPLCPPLPAPLAQGVGRCRAVSAAATSAGAAAPLEVDARPLTAPPRRCWGTGGDGAGRGVNKPLAALPSLAGSSREWAVPPGGVPPPSPFPCAEGKVIIPPLLFLCFVSRCPTPSYKPVATMETNLVPKYSSASQTVPCFAQIPRPLSTWKAGAEESEPHDDVTNDVTKAQVITHTE